MPKPQWSNAFNRLEYEKVHRLDSYMDDAQEITSPKTYDQLDLPVLNPRGQMYNKEYKVALSRLANKDLARLYMVGDNVEHYKRCYVVWVGIDLDRFKQIKTEDRFFEVLNIAITSEQVFIQDTTPLKGPFMPKRAFWMSMHGYFGNWYNPEERNWAILAAKRHVRLMRKLRDRRDLLILDEHFVPSCSGDFDWAKHERHGELGGEFGRRQDGFKDFDISKLYAARIELDLP